MIIPKFWAEGRARHRSKERQLTVRRFGWSNQTESEAQAMADQRAQQALQRLLGGDKLPSREAKVSYNGAEGVPIREEVISEHGSAVITRNIYGALCLNTPNVLFADIDLPKGSSLSRTVTIVMVLIAVSFAVGVYRQSFAIGMIGIVASLLLGPTLARLLHRAGTLIFGDEGKQAMKRLQTYVKQHPGWAVRVYQTPAGFRLLATHRTFSPEDPEALAFFEALRTDGRYVAMCRNQQCFRARLTPKPWRIGIAEHLKPRPGVWPISPERMPDRRAWVARYEQESKPYSACRYVTSVGAGTVDPQVERVQKLHDDQARALSGLPIA